MARSAFPLPARTCSVAPARPSTSRRAARAAVPAARSQRRPRRSAAGRLAAGRRPTRASAADRCHDPAVAGVAHRERDAVPPLAVLDHSHDVDVRTAGRRLGTHRDQLRTSPGDARRHSRRRRLQLTQQRGRRRSDPSRLSAAVAVRQIALEERASRGGRCARLARRDGGRVRGFAFASRSRWPATARSKAPAMPIGGDPRGSAVPPDSDAAGGSVRIADGPAGRSERASRQGDDPGSPSVRTR